MDDAVLFEQRQRKQQPGDKLGTDVSGNGKVPAGQCPLNGKRHGFMIMKPNALLSQTIKIGCNGTGRAVSYTHLDVYKRQH